MGSLVLDTGAEVSIVSSAFAAKAGLTIAPHSTLRFVRTPGATFSSTGTTSLSLCLQLMIEVEGILMHWDRYITLHKVWVVNFLGPSPRDLYIAYADWRQPSSPLGQLVTLVSTGTKVINERRAPPPGVDPLKVSVVLPGQMPGLAAISRSTSLADALLERIPLANRHLPVVQKLLSGLLERQQLFTPLDPTQNTTTVEFKLLSEPVPVSFFARRNRAVPDEAYKSQLAEWEALGQVKRVPRDTPAYGFAFLIPKESGGYRLTISPKAVNDATERISPEGGYMPPSMVQEVHRLSRKRFAASLDLASAFLTLNLGPEAQRLSTFTTPVGKYQWRVGWFGWHSFPAKFQQIMMELVVLPTLDEHTRAAILAWIDDLVLGADTPDELVDLLFAVLDRILAIGGRLSLDKCTFLTQIIDWCGLEIDLKDSTWRISSSRVSTLNTLPIPTTRDALGHVLGILRYYYFGIDEQLLMREHMAKLIELERPSVQDIRPLWTEAHTAAMRAALQLVVKGNWLALFDPALPIYITTDAAGGLGYAITCFQLSRDGSIRPLLFFSAGWQGKQATWPPQVKEAFAARQSVMVHVRKAFPYATYILLGDNKNLSALAESQDPRVVRYQNDITMCGVVLRQWIPGDWNSIADYGSRAVVSSAAPMSTSQERDASLFALEKEEEGSVVPGHITHPPDVQAIVDAQALAPEAERSSWSGANYKLLRIGSALVHSYKDRYIIPTGDSALRNSLLFLCHDDADHLTGSSRMIYALTQQCRVHWRGLHADVAQYIASCFRCQFAKAAKHKPSLTGTVNPTMAPRPHHTWYMDLKGAMPKETGYILVIVDAFSRYVSLRKCNDATSTEVCLEILEAAYSFGTFPVIIRADRGPCFDSAEFRAFCKEHAITYIPGIADHHQGQGLVETRMRPLAEALIATLGAKAPSDWNYLKTLPKLEFLFNSTFCDGVRGSPYYVLHGHEPRTTLSAHLNWADSSSTAQLLGHPAIDAETINNLISEHHTRINHAQRRASMATCLAQALTKYAYDSARVPSTFKLADTVLIHYVAPNKMLPHFHGPWVITRILAGDNFVHVKGWIDPTVVLGPIHVSRLLPFDASRATRADVAEFLAAEGQYIIARVIEHRFEPDGTRSFHLGWRGTPVTSWLPEKGLESNQIVTKYREANGLSSIDSLATVVATRPRRGRKNT